MIPNWHTTRTLRASRRRYASMRKRLGLSTVNSHTQYAPLAALGSRLQQPDFFAPPREHVQLDCKTILRAPGETARRRQHAGRPRLSQADQHAPAAGYGARRRVGTGPVCRPVDDYPGAGVPLPPAVDQLWTAVDQIYRCAGRALGLTPAQRRRTVLRLDGGFGTMPTSTGPSGMGTRCWPKGIAANGRTPIPGP